MQICEKWNWQDGVWDRGGSEYSWSGSHDDTGTMQTVNSGRSIKMHWAEKRTGLHLNHAF